MWVKSIILIVIFLLKAEVSNADPTISTSEEAQKFELNATETCGNWTVDLRDYVEEVPESTLNISCSDITTRKRKCKEHLTLDLPLLCKGLTNPLQVKDVESFLALGLDKEWLCQPFKDKLMPLLTDFEILLAEEKVYNTLPDKQLNKIRRARNVSEDDTRSFALHKNDDDGSISLTLLNNTLIKFADLPDWMFDFFGGVVFGISEICETSVPLEFESQEQNTDSDASNEQPIGIDLSIVDSLDIKQLATKLKNDTDLDNIFQRFVRMRMTGEKPFPSSFALPVLKRSNYDPSHIFGPLRRFLRDKQSTSVWGSTSSRCPTLSCQQWRDYDMDVWLRMTWRDVRLAHGFPRPILINEQTFLKKFWRPDPFFSNAKDSLFHKVTFPNFYLLIFPNGEMFFESRIHLKPSCQLLLCRYPHDNQACSVKLTSIGFTNDLVQFYWFSRKEDAIFMNKNVQFPDLYVFNHQKKTCNGARKSGNFSCLEAKFYLKRNLGSHLAQTYVPTATCVLFSWISVWLPEEFVEGRVFVSLTVFLTLSAENNAAKEVLPKVSYIKTGEIPAANLTGDRHLVRLHNNVRLQHNASSDHRHLLRAQQPYDSKESGQHKSADKHL
ncbi:hypothetical protein L596_002965 [Steinernema carpocapsae]|uniref:Neurotransmitter-gated ion-channel ligand-binding domain-containing protein n=1 Tax=Steinernema carpocapsae TaxID=34508 RepID=A0A4U8UR32_STECR|nr:hypothetical protein L596_002965 [Steinernema carpocapsae]